MQRVGDAASLRIDEPDEVDTAGQPVQVHVYGGCGIGRQRSVEQDPYPLAEAIVECTTDPAGACVIDKSGIKGNQASATFTVETLSGTDVTYVASANHDPDGDSDGTTIVVTKP